MVDIKSNIIRTDAIEWAVSHFKGVLSDVSNNQSCFTLELTRDEEINPQGYNRQCKDGLIILTAFDESGFMYGILDLCQEIIHHKGIRGIEDIQVTPLIQNRGIKLNIPLDARTPSYSDASDSAFNNIESMWDFSFWTEFLDRMAIDRYNTLSLWSLSPFPSLVRIPDYPLIALEDVKKSLRPIKADLSGCGMYDDDMAESLVVVKRMTMDEKIEFWQDVMKYAKKRCIKIYIFTWNLFLYGLEDNPYDITCDQRNPITKDYFYKATKALMDTYPLLAGIGITSGENMLRDRTDIPFLASSYGRAVRDYLVENPGRQFRFIHRMHYTGYENIISEYEDFPCPFELSFKYSQAHMYSSTKPAFIDSLLQEIDKDQRLWLTVRNDDYYMYRWGDPEFAREYISQMPVEYMTGFYMGADGFTWGRDYMDLRDMTHPLFISKMWYMFRIWGQLSYNINLSNEYFIDELSSRFDMDGSDLYEVWKTSSRIIPELNRLHWHDYDFQWYPEGCCMYDFEKDKLVFADVNEFMTCRSMPGEDVYSISEYCDMLLSGGDDKMASLLTATSFDAASNIEKTTPFDATEDIEKTTPFDAAENIEKTTPFDVASNIEEYADQAMYGVQRIRASATKRQERELLYTLDDIEAMALLGFYYSNKIKGATFLCLYGKSRNKRYRENAVCFLRTASDYWLMYSEKSKIMYKPQLLDRLCGIVDVQRFDILTVLDVNYALE